MPGEVRLLLAYLVCFIFFTVPGLALSHALYRRGKLPFYLILPAAVVISSLSGYAGFWLYFFSAPLGRIYSFASLFGTIVILIRRLLRSNKEPFLNFLLLWPIVVTFLIGSLYLCCQFHHGGTSHVDHANFYYFQKEMPGDNMIPLVFARSILGRDRPLIGRDAAGWQFSDRPPLQVGVVLWLWPLRMFGTSVFYPALGVILQVQWVIGLICICRAMQLTARCTAFVVFLTATSGFVYFNSVFVWPKFLACALFLLALCPLIRGFCARERLHLNEIAFAASAGSLALLTHGGVLFSILAVPILIVWIWQQFPPHSFDMSLLLLATLYGPWVLYQKFVDPPGNRLIKMHLAAHHRLDDLSAAQAIIHAYRRLTWSVWVQSRLENVTRIAGNARLDKITRTILKGLADGRSVSETPERLPDGLENIVDNSRLGFNWESLAALERVDQQNHVLRTLGILNLAWILLAWEIVRTRGRWFLHNRSLSLLLAMTTVSMGVWSLAMLQIGSTITAHASYAMILLLYLITAVVIYEQATVIKAVILGVHLIVSTVFWVLLIPHSFAYQHLPLSSNLKMVPLIGSALSFLLLTYFCFRSLPYQSPVEDVYSNSHLNEVHKA